MGPGRCSRLMHRTVATKGCAIALSRGLRKPGMPECRGARGGESRLLGTSVRFSLSGFVHSAVMLVLGSAWHEHPRLCLPRTTRFPLRLQQFSTYSGDNSWMARPSRAMTQCGGKRWSFYVSAGRETSEVSIAEPHLSMAGVTRPDSRGCCGVGKAEACI